MTFEIYGKFYIKCNRFSLNNAHSSCVEKFLSVEGPSKTLMVNLPRHRLKMTKCPSGRYSFSVLGIQENN